MVHTTPSNGSSDRRGSESSRSRRGGSNTGVTGTGTGAGGGGDGIGRTGGGTGSGPRMPQSPTYLQNIPGINMIFSPNDPSIRTIKQHYYPEGGWGWITVSVAAFVHFITAALTPAVSLLVLEIASTFSPDSGLVASVFIGSLCTMVTLVMSPVIIAISKRKGIRLMAVLGGLITALGCLFTSFATQFHQLFFSVGLFIGVGSAMIRDPAVLMVGQYFKKKRELVEIFLLSGYGLGVSFMPLFLTFCIRAKSWRFGFQMMSLITSLAFFLGVLYRPASLYHPQRRAILHLKSLQKRSRLKDQHLKAQHSLGSAASTTVTNIEKPAYFDFSVLKSRTIQIMLSGTCISHFGLTVPLFLLSVQGKEDGLSYESLMQLQIYLGLGIVFGVMSFGFIVVKNSVQCMISRQYLCQTSGFLVAASILLLTAFDDYTGYRLFVWIYGFFYGGYSYSLKMFLLEKVRARNFNRAWGFVQLSQAVPIFVGVPITIFLNQHFSTKGGFYLSSFCTALGSAVLFFIDAHKKSKHHHRGNISRVEGGKSPEGHHSDLSLEELNGLNGLNDGLEGIRVDPLNPNFHFVRPLAGSRNTSNSLGDLTIGDNNSRPGSSNTGRLSPFAAKAPAMDPPTFSKVSQRRLFHSHSVPSSSTPGAALGASGASNSTHNSGGGTAGGAITQESVPIHLNQELTCISEEILDNFLEDSMWVDSSLELSTTNKDEGYLMMAGEKDEGNDEREDEEEEGPGREGREAREGKKLIDRRKKVPSSNLQQHLHIDAINSDHVGRSFSGIHHEDCPASRGNSSHRERDSDEPPHMVNMNHNPKRNQHGRHQRLVSSSSSSTGGGSAGSGGGGERRGSLTGSQRTSSIRSTHNQSCSNPHPKDHSSSSPSSLDFRRKHLNRVSSLSSGPNVKGKSSLQITGQPIPQQCPCCKRVVPQMCDPVTCSERGRERRFTMTDGASSSSGVIFEQSSTDDEESEMIRREKRVLKREEEEEEEEDEGMNAEDGTFEQEDTIVYFHREVCVSTPTLPVATDSRA